MIVNRRCSRIEDEDKYRYSLAKEDRMLDDELLNALKDVK